MFTVAIPKDSLLRKLAENRAAHRAIYEKALEGYRKFAIKQFEKALDDAKQGKKIRGYIALTEPKDQTKDYNRAIAMLEMCVDGDVEIGEREFDQYVLDNWDWKDQFTTTNALYVANEE